MINVINVISLLSFSMWKDIFDFIINQFKSTFFLLFLLVSITIIQIVLAIFFGLPCYIDSIFPRNFEIPIDPCSAFDFLLKINHIYGWLFALLFAFGTIETAIFVIKKIKKYFRNSRF